MTQPSRPIQKGDTVRHKSTGRTMTVVEVYGPLFRYRYVCEWADGRTKRDLFRADDIEPLPDPPPAAGDP